MNMFKKNGGFTLVELIVVIAILAILAGIAVPAYSGYIAKANDAADTTALGAVKTAALAAWATTGSVDEIVVTTADGKVTEVKIKGTDTETKGDDGSVTNSYKVLYTYAKLDGADDETQNWENDDFKVYMNNDMITLKGNTFKNGATWTTAGGWECTHVDSDNDKKCDNCGETIPAESTPAETPANGSNT